MDALQVLVCVTVYYFVVFGCWQHNTENLLDKDPKKIWSSVWSVPKSLCKMYLGYKHTESTLCVEMCFKKERGLFFAVALCAQTTHRLQWTKIKALHTTRCPSSFLLFVLVCKKGINNYLSQFVNGDQSCLLSLAICATRNRPNATTLHQ